MAIQLTDIFSLDAECISFSPAKETTIPGSYRITISAQYPNKTSGPLVICTDNVYSFGIQENHSLEKPPRVTGYSVPLCLWNKEGPTAYQLQFIRAIEMITDHFKSYLLRQDVKKSIKKYDLEMSDLKKFSPLWYKKEDGQIVQGRGPMLYPKLMSSNTDLKIYTVIADQNGRDIDPLKLLNEKCTVRACIKFESIFIGSKISLQIKVLELEVQQQGSSRPRLICKTAEVFDETETEEHDDNNDASAESGVNPLEDESEVYVDDNDLLEKSGDEKEVVNDFDAPPSSLRVSPSPDPPKKTQVRGKRLPKN